MCLCVYLCINASIMDVWIRSTHMRCVHNMCLHYVRKIYTSMMCLPVFVIEMITPLSKTVSLECESIFSQFLREFIVLLKTYKFKVLLIKDRATLSYIIKLVKFSDFIFKSKLIKK